MLMGRPAGGARGRHRERRMDLRHLRQLVEAFFTPEALAEALGRPRGETEAIALDCLARPAKLRAPLLSACALLALSRDAAEPPRGLRTVAVAVECTRRASRIHEDIVRQSAGALHERYGLPVALNVGDYLIAEAFRLLAACDSPRDARAELLCAAAESRRALAIAGGQELNRARRRPLTTAQVLDVFANKAAADLEAALRLGAIAAAAPPGTIDALGRYGRALGIARRIAEDIGGLCPPGSRGEVRVLGMSVVLAIGCERAEAATAERMAALWRRESITAAEADELRRSLASLGAQDRARELMAARRREADQALAELDSAPLAGALREIERQWAGDAEDAPGRPATGWA
jgi:geranylgeranyl pyrophosphate synthase